MNTFYTKITEMSTIGLCLIHKNDFLCNIIAFMKKIYAVSTTNTLVAPLCNPYKSKKISLTD